MALVNRTLRWTLGLVLATSVAAAAGECDGGKSASALLPPTKEIAPEEKILRTTPCEIRILYGSAEPDKPQLVMDSGHCAYVADLALSVALADLLKRTTTVPK